MDRVVGKPDRIDSYLTRPISRNLTRKM